MSERDQDANELDRFWDDLLSGNTDVAGYAIDPSTCDALRTFLALVPSPRPSSLSLVDQVVRAAIDHQESRTANRDLWQDLAAPALPISVNESGQPTALATTRPTPRRRWQSRSYAVFVTSALVLLTLGGGLVALRDRQPSPIDADRLAILPALEIGPESTLHAAPQVVEEIWETRGGPGAQLFNPFGLEVAPDGNLWVSDGIHGQVQIFAPDGTFIESWGTSGQGKEQFNLKGNNDVAFDASGNIYVADADNFRVQKFNSDREFLTAWGAKGSGPGQFLSPMFIKVGPDGSVYVSDDQRGDVQRFDANGQLLNTIGEPGRGEGQLSNPGGVAIDRAGSVWVCDYNNNRIEQFTSDGTFLRTWGRAGNREGELSLPNDIAFDAEGRIYVLESGNKRIQVFDQNFASVMTFGREDLSPRAMLNTPQSATGPWFVFPAALALDQRGRVYVSDTMGNFIAAFRVEP